MNSRYNRPGVLPTLCRVSFGLLAMTAFGAPSPVQRYDFQPTNGPVAAGFRPVTPADTNVALLGYGFITPPATSVDGSRQTWQIFDRLVTVTQAILAAELSDATRDCVTTRGARTFAFRTEVPPGDYDVTVWLGNITRPLFQVRATVNGRSVDVERMDVLISRGRLDQTTLPDGTTPSIGNAVPRTVRVSAPDGHIDVAVGPGPNGTNAVAWTYWLDESISLLGVLLQLTRTSTEGTVNPAGVDSPAIEVAPKLSRTPKQRAPTPFEITAAIGRILFRPSDPPTRLKGRLGTVKKAVWSEPISLPEIKEIAKSHRATINHVLMAVAAGAIRRYIEEHNDPRKPNICAFVLVNMRGRSFDDELGNKFGLVFLPLPLDRERPLERLSAVKQGMDILKASRLRTHCAARRRQRQA